MIDENILHDRLTDAAAAQDGLLPRAPAEDLAAGRRRLRVRQSLIGAAATIAVAAVAAAGFSWRPSAGDPVAGQKQTVVSPTAPTEAQRAEMLRRAETFLSHRPPGELVTARYLSLLLASARENGAKDPEHVAGELSPGGIRIELSTYGAARTGACSELLSMPSCAPATLADGGRGQYAEGPDATKYVRTVRYVNPVGSEIVIRVIYPSRPSAKTEPTKAVVLALVADPSFRRTVR